MRAELVLKRARYKHSRYTQGEEARGRKNVGWFRAELHHFSLPLPPPSIHHFRSPRSRVPLPYSRARRQFPATMFRFYLSLLFLLPKQRRVALSPPSLYRLLPSRAFLLPHPQCVLFDRCPFLSCRSFLLPFDARSKFTPSSLGDDLPFGERRRENRDIHPFLYLLHRWSTNEQINLLKLCFILFFLVLIRRWWWSWWWFIEGLIYIFPRTKEERKF